ncbi:MAG TPA: outer membrane lipoprotein chaperone LolA [Gemmatimonadota bacterium]|nr:outer membrane lipoprotein chaperone LolA [Gemmatimonadota bacterium]
MNRGTGRLGAGLLALSLLHPTAGLGTQGDPEQVLRRADRALDGLTTLRAEFDQQVYNPVLERTTTGHGTLTYRSPELFRIAYSDPEGDVVVNDGERVWIYLPSSQPGQVIRQPAAASEVQNPLTYLRDLRDRYVAVSGGTQTVAGRPTDRLVLTPAGPRAPFMLLEVWVERETGFLRRVRTRTDEGVATTYTFVRLEPNARLSAGAFEFEPPRGVEIFDS